MLLACLTLTRPYLGVYTYKTCLPNFRLCYYTPQRNHFFFVYSIIWPAGLRDSFRHTLHIASVYSQCF